jgi:hypothetical protein
LGQSAGRFDDRRQDGQAIPNNVQRWISPYR